MVNFFNIPLKFFFQNKNYRNRNGLTQSQIRPTATLLSQYQVLKSPGITFPSLHVRYTIILQWPDLTEQGLVSLERYLGLLNLSEAEVNWFSSVQGIPNNVTKGG